MLPLFVDLTLQNEADTSRFYAAMAELQREYDPYCRFTPTADLQTVTLHSVCDDYLEVFVGTIREKFSVPLKVGAPQIAYRRTIIHTTKADFTHKIHSRELRQFAQLTLHFETMALGAGAQFRNATRGETLSQDYVTAIAEGLAEAKECGTLSGFPYTDFLVTLTHATYNEFSSPEAFAVAARMAFRQGIRQARPVLLEPIMKVEVKTPEDFLGDVIGDLNNRRGMVQSMDEKDGKRVIVASVPLATMFGYLYKLRRMTKARADYHMEYSHYDTVPTNKAPTPPDDRFPSAVGMRQVPYTSTKLDGNSGNGR